MKTKLKSRSAETREEQTKEYEFKEPNWLDIPDSVVERLKSQGMVLRWIRISLKGWVFIEPSEVPEMLASSVVMDNGRYENCVVRGDVALAKMPQGQADSRTGYYEKKSRDMVEAVNQQLMSQNDSRMPISNQSKSSVTKGRQPKFQS